MRRKEIEADRHIEKNGNKQKERKEWKMENERSPVKNLQILDFISLWKKEDL